MRLPISAFRNVDVASASNIFDQLRIDFGLAENLADSSHATLILSASCPAVKFRNQVSMAGVIVMKTSLSHVPKCPIFNIKRTLECQRGLPTDRCRHVI